MSLTIFQIQNIHKLDTDTAIELMHECAERLGVVSVNEYCLILGKKKRSVYYGMKRQSIKFVTIVDRDYPCINDCV